MRKTPERYPKRNRGKQRYPSQVPGTGKREMPVLVVPEGASNPVCFRGEKYPSNFVFSVGETEELVEGQIIGSAILTTTDEFDQHLIWEQGSVVARSKKRLR